MQVMAIPLLFSMIVKKITKIDLSAEIEEITDIDSILAPESISAHESILALAATCTEMMNKTLTWIREFDSAKEKFWDSTTFAMAADMGQIQMVDWLHEHGCPWNKYTCMSAAAKGNLKVLQYLREHGCPWDEHTCLHAANGGHLSVLQWARNNGCPWDERTCMSAAGKGYLKVLEYAVTNKCPWDRYSICNYAATRGQSNVLLLYGFRHLSEDEFNGLVRIFERSILPRW
jgi:hypothetical protein